MRVLVIGQGAREHTLCWKIAESKRVDTLFCAPGNGGISDIAECVDIKADDIDKLLDFAKSNKIDLTVVGPEVPLVEGIVDKFNKENLKIFGPDKNSAALEGSKIFSKQAMKRFNVLTADFEVFDNPEKAKSYIKSKDTPLVIKADGLCAGKGVIVAKSKEEALSAVDSIMISKDFGKAGKRIIIEDCLLGEEASIIIVSDGKDFIQFPSSQDHKRALDNDQGPNTGGMGAYSPAPVMTDKMSKQVEDDIIRPIIEGLYNEGTPYKGVLYIGLMIVDNKPYILEFNVRFGDPETQVILPKLKSDLLDIIESSIDGNIKDITPEWDDRASVCVVCASGGYPGTYEKNLTIEGLDKASLIDDVVVFHAGTKKENSKYLTTGGRVLGVMAMAEDIKKAIDKSYEAVNLINFNNMHYRKDIGYKAMERIKS